MAVCFSAGAKIADEFFGVMFYSLGPLIMFAIGHFNLIMFIRRRNRLINKRNADYAFQQG